MILGSRLEIVFREQNLARGRLRGDVNDCNVRPFFRNEGIGDGDGQGCFPNAAFAIEHCYDFGTHDAPLLRTLTQTLQTFAHNIYA